MKRIRSLLLVLIVVFSTGWFAYYMYQRARGAMQARIDQSVSVQQMRDLSVAATTYVATHGNFFPATVTVLLAASPGLSPGVLISPLSPDQSVPSYEMVAPAVPINQISDPAHTPLMRSRFTTRDGKRILAFCDGHIEMVSE